ncbi:MAG TPA: hypothetical protein VK216_03175, partial [Magnetospirillaceae bacterium]|nr:hypothetical protein [Magnetospirillaceae bacterium]
MTAQAAGWVVAAVCALAAAAVFVWQRRRIVLLADALARTERRLALLGEIAPPLTQAARESTPQTCERIVERLSALVRTQTALCFIAIDGRMQLGAKSDAGYAEFLQIGDAYEGDSILDWAQRNHCAAIIGPVPADLPAGTAIDDLSKEPEGARLGGP